MRRSCLWLLALLGTVMGCGGGGGGGGGSPGALDGAFATGGLAFPAAPVGSFGAVLRGMAVHADGRVVLAESITFGMSSMTRVTRLLANGTPDPAFDGDGFADVAEPPGGLLVVNEVALQPDGRILLAGSAFFPAAGTTKPLLARLTTLGAMDATFGTGGIVLFDVALEGELEFDDVFVDTADRVIGVGFGTNAAGNTDLLFARVSSTGIPDAGFNGLDGDPAGVQIIDLSGGVGGNEDILSGVALPDGSIVAVGRTDLGTSSLVNTGLAVRLNPAGLLDTSFDGDGIVLIGVPGSDFSLFYDVLRQPDGKLVCAGSSFFDPETRVVCARLLPGGALDPAFRSGDGDPAGLNVFSVGGLAEDVSIARHPDGSIVIGCAGMRGAGTEPLVARVGPGGALRTSFAPGGVFEVGLGGFCTVVSTAVDAAGRMLIAGDRDDEVYVARVE